jgi:hypothetical protein
MIDLKRVGRDIDGRHVENREESTEETHYSRVPADFGIVVVVVYELSDVCFNIAFGRNRQPVDSRK